ncbi:peptide ABC transporter ATP-binding protein, partial [Lactiplantibacillus plantarum]
ATTWQLPGKVDVISVVSAIAGTVLIVTEGHTDSLALPVIAIIWGLLAAVGATIYTLMPAFFVGKLGNGGTTSI